MTEYLGESGRKKKDEEREGESQNKAKGKCGGIDNMDEETDKSQVKYLGSSSLH